MSIRDDATETALQIRRQLYFCFVCYISNIFKIFHKLVTTIDTKVNTQKTSFRSEWTRTSFFHQTVDKVFVCLWIITNLSGWVTGPKYVTLIKPGVIGEDRSGGWKDRRHISRTRLCPDHITCTVHLVVCTGREKILYSNINKEKLCWVFSFYLAT